MANRIPIHPTALNNILASNDEVIRIRNFYISERAAIELNNPVVKQYYFVNCLFENGLHIKISGTSKLYLFETEIKLDLTITEFNQLHRELNPELLITNSEIEHLLIRQSNFNHIHISETKIENLLIENVSLVGKSIVFENMIVNDSFTIYGLNHSKKLWIDNLICKGYCTLEKICNTSINLSRTEFKDDLDLIECGTDLNFDRIVVDGNTSITNSNIRQLVIENSSFTKLIYLDYTEDWHPTCSLEDDKSQARWIIGNLKILSSSFKGGFNFGIDWVESQLLPVKEINLSCTSISNGDIFFENLEIGDLKFMGMNKEGSFHFYDCTVEANLFFYQFTNQGKIIINSLNWGRNAQLYFQNSIVGPAHFTDVDFTLLGGFNFFDSDISQISYSSVTWPDNLPDIANRPTAFNKFYWRSYFYQQWLRFHWYNLPGSHEDVDYYANKREMYRQLKSSAEKMHDRVQSLAFQRMEMKAYNKVLCLTKSMLNLERIILFLSRTNEYGQNWWRPIWLAAIITFIFFIPIVIGIDPQLSLAHPTHAEVNNSLIAQFWKWHGIYPQLLNPVHSLDRMVINPAAIHPTTWWLDYGHRIIMAFFIFQTISAFRKYVKS